MRLTKHFSVEEFAQPARHGFFHPAPYPKGWIESRLRPLCEALEVLRAELGGKPVRVLSGYRSALYNRQIGGARKSQHVQGRAADITVDGISAEKVHAATLKLYREGRLKIGGLGLYPSFVHIDVRPRKTLARWRGSRSEQATRGLA